MHRSITVLFPMLLAVCSAEPAGPSRALAAFGADPWLQQVLASLRDVRDSGSRGPLRVDPPGRHFSICHASGAIVDQAVPPLLDSLAALCVAHVRLHEGEADAVDRAQGAVPDAVLEVVLARPLAGIDRTADLHVRSTPYRVGGAQGSITVAALREPGGEGRWRIAGALHEP